MLKVSAARICQIFVVLSLGLLTGCQTPEERAQRDQFRRDMDNRRRQRGLPVTAR